MTVMAEREAQMLPEEFEESASAAPETVTWSSSGDGSG